MKTVIHRAQTRGYANYGWLESRHTFSFANYHNPDRMHFGMLRVLNDDTIAAGTGFGTHPHDNMEIISIPLEGALEHRDSMGNTHVIRAGDVQVMSAGIGITHSEYNNDKDNLAKFLQIWVFPDKRNVEPRYGQLSLGALPRNILNQIISPTPHDEKLWIHQDAWFSMADLDPGIYVSYTLKGRRHGVYIFVIDGEVSVADAVLKSRDGCGIWESREVAIQALTPSRILIMEVPMTP